jgi:hypothetical protein
MRPTVGSMEVVLSRENKTLSNSLNTYRYMTASIVYTHIGNGVGPQQAFSLSGLYTQYESKRCRFFLGP